MGVEFLKDELARAEELRAAAGGEVLADPVLSREKYDQAILTARSVFAESGLLLRDVADSGERRNLILIFAGAVNLVASAYESRAKHVLETPEEIDVALNEAFAWLDKLNPHLEILKDLGHGPHGSPYLWSSEICRSLARTFERRPRDRRENLERAAEWYELAIDLGERKIVEATETGDETLLNGAQSVTGVAMGELARVHDMLIHETGANFSEQIIQTLYVRGRNLVWLTKNIPNYDRLDAVEGRVFQYLREHDISPDHPDFQETLEHWKELYEESDLVRSRMKKRVEQSIIPDQHKDLFID